MSRRDCINWLTQSGYPIPPKSACIGCPYRNDQMWLQMKQSDANSWKEALKIDQLIKKLPKIKGEAFLHRSCQPLEKVRFRKSDTREQDDFINECEGYCGV